MFTDLVDSTALLSRLGEERGEAVRREHFALLRGAVEPCGGREVKNLGDGLMVAFSSAADAVSAAAGAQQAFARRNRRAGGSPLLVRIGISCGDADVEDDDYFGVPVVEAARLCGTAGGGEVLATELVRLLAGSRGGHTFTALGALELKGLDGPVEAHRIEWEGADAGQETLPCRPDWRRRGRRRSSAVTTSTSISVATVKTHLVHTYDKLAIRSRAELAAQAARRSGPAGG